MKKGFIQVYTGNGKGKTTAAIGLIIRSIGAGNKAYLGQFLKNGDYSEIKLLKKLENQVVVEQFGSKNGFYKKGQDKINEEKIAKEAVERLKFIVSSGEYDLIVIDEINVAVYMGLIPVSSVIEIIEIKPLSTELILTGVYAHEEIIKRADLVTEMKKIKHYYDIGIKSRVGIEE